MAARSSARSSVRLRTVRPRTVAGCLLIAGLALTGCSKASTKQPSSSSPSSTSPSSTATSAKPTSTAPSASPSSTEPASLGGRCDDLLPVSTIDIALARPVVGKTAFILGIAEPKIGRLTYLNCRYGVRAAAKGKPAPAPLVEIGISLYQSATQANLRVQGTVDDYLANGATQSRVVVDQYPATVLLGHGSPTLVVSAGPRTVAVTLDSTIASRTPAKGLAALAKAALDATKSFTGVGGAPPAGSPSATATS